MAAMTIPNNTVAQQLLVTVDNSVSIESLKQAIKMLKGVIAISKPKTITNKAQLYDPETGEYLNEETMKAIEDVRNGKDEGVTYSSFEDFENAMRTL